MRLSLWLFSANMNGNIDALTIMPVRRIFKNSPSCKCLSILISTRYNAHRDSPISPSSPLSFTPSRSRSLDDTIRPKSSTEQPRTKPREYAPTVAPNAVSAPLAGEVLAEETAQLHLFDAANGVFMLQDESVKATVTEIGTWHCTFHANNHLC
jgi:hypothetical protein